MRPPALRRRSPCRDVPMVIRIKVAESEREVDDALWVRHEVFVVEEGKLGGKPLASERIVDRFDAFPDVHHVIAYAGAEPIATLRLVREGVLGLPAEEHFDFSGYREAIARKRPGGAVFGSAGMLAVRQAWRGRRDVVRGMFRVAAGVSVTAGITHLLVVVDHHSARMYRRFGFKALAERFWVEAIGSFVVPLAAGVERFHAWAFADPRETGLPSEDRL